MKLITNFVSVLFLSLFLGNDAFSSCDPDKKVYSKPEVEKKSFYGEDFILEGELVDITYALDHFESMRNQDIQVKASVVNVCQNKGCWMSLGSKEDQTIRVRFQDYGFFVPVSLIGRDVALQGTLSRVKVEKKLLQHFKEDAGATKEEIAAVNEDVYEYTFTASGVRVL